MNRRSGVKNKRIEAQAKGRVLNMIRAERDRLQTQAKELTETLIRMNATLMVMLAKPDPGGGAVSLEEEQIRLEAWGSMENATAVLQKYEKKT